VNVDGEVRLIDGKVEDLGRSNAVSEDLIAGVFIELARARRPADLDR